jgi:signal transduction histidine kinase
MLTRPCDGVVMAVTSRHRALNDILDLSKIEADKVALAQSDLALDELLDHVRSIVPAAADAK